MAESEDRVVELDGALDNTTSCSDDTGAGSEEVTCSGDETDSVADSFEATYDQFNVFPPSIHYTVKTRINVFLPRTSSEIAFSPIVLLRESIYFVNT